jgi:hypothetical protein
MPFFESTHQAFFAAIPTVPGGKGIDGSVKPRPIPDGKAIEIAFLSYKHIIRDCHQTGIKMPQQPPGGHMLSRV